VKKLFIPIIVMAALLTTACGHRNNSGSATDTDSVATDTAAALTIDSVGLSREDSIVCVSISLDWPVSGGEALTAAIRRYICEELAAGLTYEGKPTVIDYRDGKTAVEATVGKQYQQLLDLWREDNSEGRPLDGMQMSYRLRVGKLEETDTYVTYYSSSEGFQGGAHGFALGTGTTFSKSDGRRIGYKSEFNTQTEQTEMKQQTLFAKPDDPRLAKLIKEGVRSYFQEFQDSTVTDAQLKDCLTGVDNIDSIPLPYNAPTFTKSGLSFVYQQYEIAPYAAGMVSFDVAYDQVRPLLTPEAARLIPKK